MKKKFDKALYAKYDMAAKDAAISLFEGTAWTVVENTDKHGVDLLVYEDGLHIGYIEVEVKNNWVGPKFQYGDVQWPERKWKFCRLDKPTIFLIFNSDKSHYLTTTGDVLLGSKLEMVRNKYIKFGEHFFKVPIKDITFDDVYDELRRLPE